MPVQTTDHWTEEETPTSSRDKGAAKGRGTSGFKQWKRDRSAASQPPVHPLQNSWYVVGKSVVEWVMAALIAIPALPVVILAALAVKLTSRGPAFYTQTRLGRRGRPFKIYKIRTMIHNAESLTGPRWSLPGDPRVTLIGRILRATHLDELPQLINVLCGEMNLIGPRPERPEFFPELEEALPAYRQRLGVRPGVTGLAQVQLPPDSDLTSVRRKLAHDLYYIRYLSPWLDARLLICTAFHAFGLPCSFVSRLLGIPNSENVEDAMQDVFEDESDNLKTRESRPVKRCA